MPDPLRILAADADVAINRLVTSALTRAGFEVRQLPGPWAVETAGPLAPALVVAGGEGRGVTAAGAARALRARGDQTPVLILANGLDPDAEALASVDPTVRVLGMPFSVGDLARAAVGLVAADLAACADPDTHGASGSAQVRQTSRSVGVNPALTR